LKESHAYVYKISWDLLQVEDLSGDLSKKKRIEKNRKRIEKIGGKWLLTVLP